MQKIVGVNIRLLFLILVPCVISVSSYTDLNNTRFFHSVANLRNSKVVYTAFSYSDMQRGNRMSSRKRFFQDLENEGTSATFETLIRNDQMNSNFIENERTYASRSTSSDNENRTVRDVLENSFSFGQAVYQKAKQGIIIEYKDHGDNIFQCVYCNAYYWRDEENTRGIYTGCCQQGQVSISLTICNNLPSTKIIASNSLITNLSSHWQS